MNMISLWQESLNDIALKGALVLGAALMAGFALSKMSAARRYPLWMAAVLSALLLPVAAAFLPAWQVLPPMTSLPFDFPKEEPVKEQNPLPARTMPEPQQKAETETPTMMVKSPIMQKTDSPAPPKTTSPFGWMLTLPMIWSVIFSLLMTRLLWGGWRLRRLAATCHEPTEDEAGHVLKTMKAVATETGLKKNPRLLLGPAKSVPMVWGIFRPCLLLPDGAQHWPTEKLRAVLLHELAHLKRRDPLALWMGQVMLAAHWFNPLAWLTLRRLRADQERACDDTVLRQGIRPSDYAQHLLDLSRQTRLAPDLSLCALAMARSAPVAGRVTAILDGGQRREAATHGWAVLLVSLSLSASLPLAMLQAALEGPKVRGRILDRNGVVLAETGPDGLRKYPLKSLASHVTGYVRRSIELNEINGTRGGYGIEKTADATLNEGLDVKLTLDARIQETATRAMAEAGIKRGAVVVMNPRSGEVLAMVSVPAYDANDFIPSISFANWDKLVEDAALPLLDRAVSRESNPGAAFLPVTALAGGMAGISSPVFECTGSVTYGEQKRSCWISQTEKGKHGKLNLEEALFQCCHCYFYQYGNAIGMQQMNLLSQRLGFGVKTGIELDRESSGSLPDSGTAKNAQPNTIKEKLGTANMAIGQGTVVVTPLQMASVTAGLASGKIFKPRLFHEFKKGDESMQSHEPELRADLSQLVPEKHLNQIREGMRREVQEGQGKTRMAQVPGVEMAGMTGTEQYWVRKPDSNERVRENRGWFIGYAPYDQPTLAFAILAEGVMSGGDCAPVARQIVEQALALNAANQGSLKAISADKLAAMAELHRIKLDMEARNLLPELKEKFREYQRKRLELEQGLPPLPAAEDKDRFKGSPPSRWNGDWTSKPVPVA